jgi:hypothetical protein
MGVGARMIARVVALGVAVLMTACGGGGDVTTADGDAGAVTKRAPAPLVRVSLPVTDWTGDDGQHVVRNTSDWASVWTAIQWLDDAAPPLTHINFKQHMLVGVTSSHGGCGGDIAITNAEQLVAPQGDEWVVQFQRRDVATPSGTVCTDDIKPVADFILLPQSALPVRFVELPRVR